MARLTTAKRKNLPTSAFAGPDRSFPIPDKSHARNALARAHFAPHPEQIAQAVKRKFPSIKQSHPHRNLGTYLHSKKSR